MKKGFYIGYKGRVEAYIYIWFSKAHGLVYVGETNNINGVIGRANDHVVPHKGTLYNRVFDKGYYLENIEDMILLSYPLPREQRFTAKETSYRISIEYLVQRRLIALCKESNKPYTLISKVTSGPYTHYEKFIQIADDIAQDFLEIYNDF